MPKQLTSPIFNFGLFICLLAATTVAQTPSPGEQQSRVVGTWEWSLDVGPSNGKASLAVSVVDGKLVGQVTAPDGALCKADNLSLKADRVSFSISRDMGIFKLAMSYAGKLDGEVIVGTFDMQVGPMKKSGKWHAKRVKSK